MDVFMTDRFWMPPGMPGGCKPYTAGGEIPRKISGDSFPAGVHLVTTPMPTPPPDPALSASLQRWRVAPPRDADFRTAVWRRSRAATARVSWPAFVHTHAVAWAVVTVIALGGAGLAGRTVARARTVADREALAVGYLVSLDPRAQAVLRP